MALQKLSFCQVVTEMLYATSGYTFKIKRADKLYALMAYYDFWNVIMQFG